MSILLVFVLILIALINATFYGGGLTSLHGFSPTLLILVVCGSFYLAGKVYAKEWGLVSDKSIIKMLFERIWLPFLTVYIFSKSEHLFLESTGNNILIILLILSLSDFDNSFSRFVRRKFSDVNEINRKLCYSVYPPKNRADIFPMDLIFMTLSIGILIKKLT